jgi:cellulose synthase operon protein C
MSHALPRRAWRILMRCSVLVRLAVVCALLSLLAGCTRDPNVRKQKYLESGDKYFADGKYREAEIQYRNAIQLDSHFAQAHYQLGQTYLRLEDKMRAFQELGRTVELDPSNYRAHTDLANLLDNARLPDGTSIPDYVKQAKPHLDILRDKVPNLPETHEAWAYYYAAQNNLSDAIKEMQQATTADQNSNRAESYLLLGIFQIRANMPDQGEASLKKAAEIDPKSMNAEMTLGGFYRDHNRLPEAEQQYRHAIDVDRKNPVPRAALAALLMQEGRKSDAEAFLQQTKKDLSDNSEGYCMLGDFYFQNGEFDRALSEYASLYDDHPKDFKVKKNYISLLILTKHFEEAAKLDNEVLKSNAHDIDALIYKGEIQIAQNDAAGAVDSLQRALSNDPDNAVARYQLGKAFAFQNNADRAESEWREATRLRPDMVDAQRDLAALEIRRNDVDGLLQTAQAVLTVAPNSAEGYLMRCTAEIAQQRFPDAQKDAEQAIQRAPQSSVPYFQMGNIRLAQKQYADAEKFYLQALDKDPASVEALGGLINAYRFQKQPDKEIAAANAQIAKVPNVSAFYDLLGTALANEKKDNNGAETALRKAVDLDKHNIDALQKLGEIENVKGSSDQALAIFEQAIKDNPREPRFYILGGELYDAKGDWERARNLYQQALGIQPDSPVASNNLAYGMLVHGGNVDMALGLAQTARRGVPESPTFADTLGWAYYQKGIYQSAISQFQEALQLAEKHGVPDDSEVHYHLGMAYEKANQIQQARQQLEKAVKLSPSNADAKKALSDLKS